MERSVWMRRITSFSFLVQIIVAQYYGASKTLLFIWPTL